MNVSTACFPADAVTDVNVDVEETFLHEMTET